MQITLNKAIKQFFKRCLNNFESSHINQYVGLYITPEAEKAVLQDFKDLGINMDSIYISTKDYLKNPYFSTIKLENINNEESEFTYNKEEVSAYYLFNFDTVQFDKQKELNDTLILKALDESYQATVLRQNDDVWMMDVPSESQTIDPYATKAHGKVLTLGLGIGYFPFMALLNPKVESVTIVERSKAVINLFEKWILPQFPHKDKITIINGDAFDYFNQKYLANFDYCFVDIHQSSDDGYQLIEKLLQQYKPPLDSVDFWIEDSCFEFMPALILIYFVNISNYQKIKVANHFDKAYKKIAKYFKAIDIDISDVDTLKNYMYNREVLRTIASLK